MIPSGTKDYDPAYCKSMPPGSFSLDYVIKIPDWESSGRVSNGGARISINVRVPGHGGYAKAPTSAHQILKPLVEKLENHFCRNDEPPLSSKYYLGHTLVERDGHWDW